MSEFPAHHDLGGSERFRCVPVEPQDDAPPSSQSGESDEISDIACHIDRDNTSGPPCFALAC